MQRAESILAVSYRKDLFQGFIWLIGSWQGLKQQTQNSGFQNNFLGDTKEPGHQGSRASLCVWRPPSQLGTWRQITRPLPGSGGCSVQGRTASSNLGDLLRPAALNECTARAQTLRRPVLCSHRHRMTNVPTSSPTAEAAKQWQQGCLIFTRVLRGGESRVPLTRYLNAESHNQATDVFCPPSLTNTPA